MFFSFSGTSAELAQEAHEPAEGRWGAAEGEQEAQDGDDGGGESARPFPRQLQRPWRREQSEEEAAASSPPRSPGSSQGPADWLTMRFRTSPAAISPRRAAGLNASPAAPLAARSAST